MIYFCTEEFLKSVTPIDNNVEFSTLVGTVESLSDMYVKDAIGSYFYNYLLLKFNSNTLTTNEANLVAIIKYYLAWYVCAETVIETAYQITNKGPQVQSGDYSSNADMKSLMFMKNHYEEKAVSYFNRLVDFLKNNKNLYTQFISDLNFDSRIKNDYFNNNKNNFSGIFSI